MFKQTTIRKKIVGATKKEKKKKTGSTKKGVMSWQSQGELHKSGDIKQRYEKYG